MGRPGEDKVIRILALAIGLLYLVLTILLRRLRVH